MAIAEALAARDPANTEWQRDLSYCLTTLASHHEKNGDDVAALRFAEQSLRIDERLSTLNRMNAIWRHDLDVTRAQVARLREKTSN